MKRCVVFLVALLVVLAGASSTETHAQIIIKLGTLAPKDSTWYRILETMGERWKQASAGKVELRIRAGTAGDESDIMRRMRVGQLQAGAVTTVGLSTIDPIAEALHIPLAFRSQEELDYVRSRMAVRMEATLLQKGFVVLNWGEAGWVRFFTKSPVASPADLKKLKLFVWAAGKSTDDIWKDNGFQPVSLSSVDILPGLQTGMITAIQVPPLAALSNQWFAITKYMTDLRWAPLTGATIITRDAWEQIPADARPALAKIARESGDQMQKEIRSMEQQALDAMVKRGLQIVKVSADEEGEWQKTVEALYPRLRGSLVPAEYFDEVMKLRDEYRRSRGGSGK
jgi:TRAP-type C4-dicarboxylate transport system substrate-binding protein